MEGFAIKVCTVVDAKLASTQGCDGVITNGNRPEALYDILGGQGVGTLFVGKR